METIDYEELKEAMITTKRNMLVLGVAGSGKSHLIKNLSQHYRDSGSYDDLLLCGPTGIASLNIGGNTIQSTFGIKPYTYNIYNSQCLNIRNIEKPRLAKILLVDEISMLRCEILDIVDRKLRIIRNNNFPFGGLRLIFTGDLFQLEPVIEKKEFEFMEKLYPRVENKKYGFFNANVLTENNYFDASFDIYRLDHIFRQNDADFVEILSEVRMGNISDKNLASLNSRVIDMKYDERCQYLTITNEMAERINLTAIKRLQGILSVSRPSYECNEGYESYYNSIHNSRHIINRPLMMKKGMKIIFVINDRKTGEQRRYVNGTMGTIIDIIGTPENVEAVLVNAGGVEFRANREKYSVFEKVDGKITEIGSVNNFPFIPSAAITIDKSQGLTLDKTVVVLGNNTTRDNQLYVALSRVRGLNHIFFDRNITREDIHLSSSMKKFHEGISERITPVVYETPVIKPVKVTIKKAGTVNVNMTNSQICA
jgi:ATP-dependent exoDNAse (exonuclease V) alpha subunit